MNQFRQLLKGTGVMAVAGLLEKGVAFLLLPLYTRYLTPSDYGAVELFLVMLAVLNILVQQGMVSATFKRLAYDERGHRLVLGTALTFVLGTSVVVGIGMIVFSDDLASLLFERAGGSHLLVVGAATLACSVAYNILLVPLRVHQRYTTVATISFGVFCAKLSANLVFLLHFDAGFMSLIYGQCAGAVAGLTAALLRSHEFVSWTFDRTEFRALARFGYPLIASSVAMLALNSTDRILLRTYGTNTDVGLYSIAAKCGYALNAFLLGPFRSTWPTVYYKIAKRQDAKKTFGRFALRFFAFGLLATLAAHWFAPYALRVLTTPAFYGASSAVGLMVGAVFLFTLNDILKVGMNIEARTHLLPLRAVLAGLVNLVLGIVLIPRFGIVGAALASVAAYVAMNVVTIWACRDFYRIEYDWIAGSKLVVTAALLIGLQCLLPRPRLVLDFALKFGLLAMFAAASFRVLVGDPRT